MKLTLSKLLTIATIGGILFGMLVAVVGGLYALDTRIDSKIDRAILPLQQNVVKIEKNVQRMADTMENFFVNRIMKGN